MVLPFEAQLVTVILQYISNDNADALQMFGDSHVIGANIHMSSVSIYTRPL